MRKFMRFRPTSSWSVIIRRSHTIAFSPVLDTGDGIHVFGVWISLKVSGISLHNSTFVQMTGLKTTFLSLLALSAIVFAEPGDSTTCPDGMVIASMDFQGLEHTNPRVVQRELLNKAGVAFSTEKFEAEKLRLQDLDLFTDIEVECTSSKLTYRFKEIFRWIPAPAGKKTDRDGLMIGLALANLNVLGEDIRAEVQYRTSTTNMPFMPVRLTCTASRWAGTWSSSVRTATMKFAVSRMTVGFWTWTWITELPPICPCSRRWPVES